MPTSSRVMVIGHPNPKGLQLDALFVDSFQQARAVIATARPSVVVFGMQNHLEEFCTFLASEHSLVKWILCTASMHPSQLIQWLNSGRVANTILEFDARATEKAVHTVLESIDQQRQQEQLMKLFTEQSKNLQHLSLELEQRVQKRQKQLSKSQKQLSEANAQMEMFHRALLGIFRAKSVAELQRSLSDVLRETLGLEWARIVFLQQSSIAYQTGENILTIDIGAPSANSAKLMLAKKAGLTFSAQESELLGEMSEAIGLALQRMQKLDQAEMLKQQWEATFDAISHPLCLTTAKFKILRMNRAFALKTKKKYKELLAKNCFQVTLGHAPKETPQFPFRLRESAFEVSGQALEFELDGEKAHLILFRDISEEYRLERRILDATKLAELGTIGSSIAHELNNPLGGMLSFLQLIKMDLPKNSPWKSDIEDMEKSTLNCSDIIRNLLSFARRGDMDDYQEIDLGIVVERAIKLIELQTKSKGITLDVKMPESSRGLPLQGSSNNLSQALCNLLQNSIDSISDKMATDPLFPGHISLTVTSTDSDYSISIVDNGMGIETQNQTQIFNPLFTTRDPSLFAGMGLTTAYSIVSEHNGRLEITSQSGSGTTAIISLTRPDFAKNSQVFDGEI